MKLKLPVFYDDLFALSEFIARLHGIDGIENLRMNNAKLHVSQNVWNHFVEYYTREFDSYNIALALLSDLGPIVDPKLEDNEIEFFDGYFVGYIN